MSMFHASSISQGLDFGDPKCLRRPNALLAHVLKRNDFCVKPLFDRESFKVAGSIGCVMLDLLEVMFEKRNCEFCVA